MVSTHTNAGPMSKLGMTKYCRKSNTAIVIDGNDFQLASLSQ